ncbi:MAG: sigma-70 family RNA polymerase sigma factor [Planctomycetota bacterium]|nr:MAG: sigma-70 family RNA polymerase sigma factor [Planctomycetota bacterium]
MAVNEALQFLRRQRTGRARLETLSAIRSDRRSPDDATARLDVEAALRTLPEDERAAVLLRYQEGLDYRAIAAVLGCAEGTVASRLNRARARLRQQLQAGYGREEETSDPVHQKR